MFFRVEGKILNQIYKGIKKCTTFYGEEHDFLKIYSKVHIDSINVV